MNVKNAEVAKEELYTGRSMAQETWRRLKKNKGAMFGIAFLLILVLSTILATMIFD